VSSIKKFVNIAKHQDDQKWKEKCPMEGISRGGVALVYVTLLKASQREILLRKETTTRH